MNLREWIVHYVKARDAVERKLKQLEEKPDMIIAYYKDKKVTYLAQETLQKDVAFGAVTIVCLQNQQNFDTLLQHFTDYAKNPDLTIMFLNPKLNEKWVLKPAVHYAVADKSTLKTGLLTMYQMVPEA